MPKAISLQQYSDSKSLWNYTLSPGWTKKEVEIYRFVLMKYGIGNWKQISGFFPHKSANQLNMQAQRMLGQQSLREFYNLNIDPRVVYSINILKPGQRKNGGCLINLGNNPDPKVISKKRDENHRRYGLSKNFVDKLQIPLLKSYEIGGSRKIVGKENEKIRHKLKRLETLYLAKERIHTEIYLLKKKIESINYSIGDAVSISGEKANILCYNFSKENKITGVRLRYDSGKYVENVPVKRLKLIKKAGNPLLSLDEALKANDYDTKFKPGDRVKIRSKFHGVIASSEGKRYSVAFDDDDFEENVQESEIELSLSPTLEAENTHDFEKYDRVILKSSLEAGSVECFVENSKAKIQLDESKQLQIAPISAISHLTRDPGFFKSGSRIECTWKNGIHWYPGKILKENKNGTYSILYDDGDTEHTARPENIRYIN